MITRQGLVKVLSPISARASQPMPSANCWIGVRGVCTVRHRPRRTDGVALKHAIL
jgi:hypothetical protein